MAETVLALAIADETRAELFESYLCAFVQAREAEALAWAERADAPYLIVRSDPVRARKVIIFQDPEAAQAFRQGWTGAAGEHR